jgi:phage/plasmid primase-like uncharacterized protein
MPRAKPKAASRSRESEQVLNLSALKTQNTMPSSLVAQAEEGIIRVLLDVTNGKITGISTDADTPVRLLILGSDSSGTSCPMSQHAADKNPARIAEAIAAGLECETAPTAGQLAALEAWKLANGRRWRSKLLDAWERSGEGVIGYAPELQQLRNSFGSAWLTTQHG